MIVDGAALAHCIEDSELRQLFLAIVLDCSTVVACRVSPRQKAQVVRMIKQSESADGGALGGNGSGGGLGGGGGGGGGGRGGRRRGPPPITLAIGDGANDAAMLLEADIGVSVAGDEGLHATQAADYTVAQFSHLTRLLFVHGAWCHHRAGVLASVLLYNQVVFNGTLLLYNLHNGLSGTPLYAAAGDGGLLGGYTSLFTLLPVVACGCFDQHVRAQTAFEYPHAYWHGQAGHGFSVPRACRHGLVAASHAAVIFFGAYSVWSEAAVAGGAPIEVFGRASHFLLVVVCNLRLLLSSHMLSALQLAAAAASIALWFVLEAARDPATLGAVVGAAAFWVATPLVCACCALPTLLSGAVRRLSSPSLTDAVRDLDRRIALDERARRRLVGKPAVGSRRSRRVGRARSRGRARARWRWRWRWRRRRRRRIARCVAAAHSQRRRERPPPRVQRRRRRARAARAAARMAGGGGGGDGDGGADDAAADGAVGASSPPGSSSLIQELLQKRTFQEDTIRLRALRRRLQQRHRGLPAAAAAAAAAARAAPPRARAPTGRPTFAGCSSAGRAYLAAAAHLHRRRRPRGRFRACIARDAPPDASPPPLPRRSSSRIPSTSCTVVVTTSHRRRPPLGRRRGGGGGRRGRPPGGVERGLPSLRGGRVALPRPRLRRRPGFSAGTKAASSARRRRLLGPTPSPSSSASSCASASPSRSRSA